MSVEDRLRELAERVPGMPLAGYSERDTERTLVEPFIEALGYDSRNPAEVKHQLPVQIGSTTGLCDYAINLNGEVRVLVECKKASISLDNQSQLASYFSQIPTALVGIYTNGIEYRFYAEHNDGRIKRMDSTPFLVLKLDSLDLADVSKAAQCGKDRLANGDAFTQWVSNLRYVRTIEDRLRRELTGQPSDELVALAMGWVGIQERMPERVEEFRVILRDAASGLLNVTPRLAPMPRPMLARSSIETRSPVGWTALNGDFFPSGRNRPIAIRLPDREVGINSWKDMLGEVASWLNRAGYLTRDNCSTVTLSTVRFRLSPDGKRQDGKPYEQPLNVGDTGIVLESDFIGTKMVRFALDLIGYFGQDPSQVYLKLP